MTDMRDMVREKYGEIGKRRGSCGGNVSSCCGSGKSVVSISTKMGYSNDELQSVPENANLGLGCGNPTALASLKEGEVVLDLGSGGGMDCFLAAQKVGKTGKVIGVDMTPEMVSLARRNADERNDGNIEFRLGEIENLPVADHTIDVIISNCVINLSPNKTRVFEEAYRVLKPGGRFMISDIVLLEALPYAVKESIDAYIGCIAGAVLKDEYLTAIRAAGFDDVNIVDEKSFDALSFLSDPFVKSLIKNLGLASNELKDLQGTIVSMKIEGRKPAH